MKSINLPRFFGRRQELEQIEKAFTQGKTRRFTICGIGGQGKTSLAIEAGQRLSRKKTFKKICLIDYASFCGMDAVGLALRTLAELLDKDLKNAAAATKVLRDIPILLILDNLETIPPAPLQELLEVAKDWSETGACRLLLTTRTDFEHPDYNSLIQLSGLAEKEALAYIQHLLKLPQLPQDERSELLSLLKQVAYHPLSINVLAIPLKVQRPAELEKRLKAWQENSMWAVLRASLEGLTLEIDKTSWLARLFKRKTTKILSLKTETLRSLPILGVFQGGAFEPDLLTLTQFHKKQWQVLRTALETAGLIQVEILPTFKVPYIKFHPSLAPILWTRLSSQEQAKLYSSYQLRYAQLAGYMFYEEGESMEQVHSLVRQDLPNLLHAVYGALDAGRRGADKFANNIDLFLKAFGLQRDSAALNQRVRNADG
ncbi:MAG: hypothetical protein ABFS56_25345, partial [Pseudomonadota bacterium]